MIGFDELYTDLDGFDLRGEVGRQLVRATLWTIGSMALAWWPCFAVGSHPIATIVVATVVVTVALTTFAVGWKWHRFRAGGD